MLVLFRQGNKNLNLPLVTEVLPEETISRTLWASKTSFKQTRDFVTLHKTERKVVSQPPFCRGYVSFTERSNDLCLFYLGKTPLLPAIAGQHPNLTEPVEVIQIGRCLAINQSDRLYHWLIPSTSDICQRFFGSWESFKGQPQGGNSRGNLELLSEHPCAARGAPTCTSCAARSAPTPTTLCATVGAGRWSARPPRPAMRRRGEAALTEKRRKGWKMTEDLSPCYHEKKSSLKFDR